LLGRLASVLYPILFAAFPLLSLFEHNQSEIELSVLWVPLTVTVAAAAALYGVLLLDLKQDGKAAAMAALVAVAVLYYGTFASSVGLRDRWFFPLWAALFVVLAVALVRVRRDLSNLTWVLGAAALVLVTLPVAGIVSYHANHPAISARCSKESRSIASLISLIALTISRGSTSVLPIKDGLLKLKDFRPPSRIGAGLALIGLDLRSADSHHPPRVTAALHYINSSK